MALTERARAMFADKTFAHVAAVDESGKPHATPVWIDVSDDEKLVINTAEGRVKDRLLKPGTWVAVSATNPQNPYDPILVRGPIVARTTEGADDVIDRLAFKYLGEESYPFRRPGEVRLTLLIDPVEVVG
jgi:PPOX class probable F420-dependent enzyme